MQMWKQHGKLVQQDELGKRWRRGTMRRQNKVVSSICKRRVCLKMQKRLRWCCFRYGDDCALNCKKGYESYHWCWKSYHDSQVAFSSSGISILHDIARPFVFLKTTFLFNQTACFLRTGSTVDLAAKHVTVLAAYRSALKMERIIGELWLIFSANKRMWKASLILYIPSISTTFHSYLDAVQVVLHRASWRCASYKMGILLSS